MKKITNEDISRYAKKMNEPEGEYIKVGMSTCGLAAGAQEVYDALMEGVKLHDLKVRISKCGCLGMCHAEPLVEVAVEGLPAVIYGKVSKDVASRIIDEHICSKRLLNDHILDLPVYR